MKRRRCLITIWLLLLIGWSPWLSFTGGPSPQRRKQLCPTESTLMIIPYGHLAVCWIAPSEDADVFQFSATAGEAVGIRVALLGGLGRVFGRLFDPEGRQIGETSNRITARVEKTGDYTIEISMSGQRALRYGLSLERLAPPSPSATPLSRGQSLNREIDPSGEVDLYFFRGAPEDQVTVRVSRRAGLGVPVAEVFDPDGEPISPASGQISARLGKAGIYTVRVSASTEFHRFTYTVTFQCSGACPPVTEPRGKP